MAIPGAISAIGWSRRLAVAAIAAAALAAFYFGWLRDSALVAVRDVKVEGVTTADRGRIVAALTGAAKQMTTLHVDPESLEAAVAGFPSVASVNADPSFPSGLTIHVVEHQPALLARAAGREVPAAADGTLLVGLEVPEKLAKELPTVQVSELPGSGRLAGGDLEQALVVGATPEPLRALVEGVSWSADEGVVVTMRGGIPIHFGDGGRAEAKWAAAAAILADPKLDSVSYLDVRVPERSAVGGSGEGVVAPPAPVPAPTDVAAADPVAPAPSPEPAVVTDPAATSTTGPTSP